MKPFQLRRPGTQIERKRPAAEDDFRLGQQPVTLLRSVRGENWLMGSQTWVSTSPAWASTWYELSDHTYVYASFIFTLLPGET